MWGGRGQTADEARRWPGAGGGPGAGPRGLARRRLPRARGDGALLHSASVFSLILFLVWNWPSWDSLQRGRDQHPSQGCFPHPFGEPVSQRHPSRTCSAEEKLRQKKEGHSFFSVPTHTLARSVNTHSLKCRHATFFFLLLRVVEKCM